jgi:protein TonB
MAQDVDLSSKEWTDIVFEGKNKEFGAYQLRNASPKRHTKSVIAVLIVLAVLLVVLILVMTGVFKSAESDVNVTNEQVNVELSQAEDTPEEDEQIDMPEPEIPEEAQLQEEVTSTQAVTELIIKEEVDKEKEQKNVEDILDNTAALGAKDAKGIEDVNKEAVRHEVVEEKPVEKPKDEGPVNVAMVEQKPSFPGGDAAMMKWLGENISYPAAASEEGVEGRVTVQFIVEKDGTVSNVIVVRGKHPALDAEAVRVVKKMPKWTPGRNNGQPVRVTYNLPVTFRLQK